MLGRAVIGTVRLYRSAISWWTPASCRYTPTCSEYAIEAVEVHGVVRGVWLALRRLCRCHPWGGFGFDPVPRPIRKKAGSDRDWHAGAAARRVEGGREMVDGR